MAKGNMLLGYARGKVGDLVFTRVDGEQVSRPRNRHPKNPRTNKQLIQRAIMATVMSAYSAGREIFDHSFQGYSVGAGCQRRFLSLNAQALRTQMAVDFENATPEEALAKVTAPKIQTPIPNQYIVAEGSLINNLFEKTDSNGSPIWNLPEAEVGEKVSEYASRVGLVAGDIYTLVGFVAFKSDANVLFKALGIASVDYDIIYRGSFAWLRLIAKNVAANDTVITENTLLSEFFDFEYNSTVPLDLSEYTYKDNLWINTMFETENSPISDGFAIGMIKSRRDQDVRSNCTLEVVNPGEFGLYWNDLLTAWKAGTTEIGASDLILEGGDE